MAKSQVTRRTTAETLSVAQHTREVGRGESRDRPAILDILAD